jgi:hypothetical protein
VNLPIMGRYDPAVIARRLSGCGGVTGIDDG